MAPCAESPVEAVHWTVLYGSIFDYPLTRDEIYRFLMPPGGSRSEVEGAIDEALARRDGLETDGTFLYPAGRSASVATRLRRNSNGRRAWKQARFYGRLIWALPYVRMVAVTGALAMDNVEQGDDIDYLIVTEPGRVWLTRGMILMLARVARAGGVTLCPNYILSSHALRLDQHDPYTAHELAQMIPLHGREMAGRLWRENAWCRNFLPNAECREEEVDDSLPRLLRFAKTAGQAVLDLRWGTALERWEQRRKIARLAHGAPPHVRETLYTADVCKGHADGHGDRVMDRWAAQVMRHRGEADTGNDLRHSGHREFAGGLPTGAEGDLLPDNPVSRAPARTNQ